MVIMEQHSKHMLIVSHQVLRKKTLFLTVRIKSGPTQNFISFIRKCSLQNIPPHFVFTRNNFAEGKNSEEDKGKIIFQKISDLNIRNRVR